MDNVEMEINRVHVYYCKASDAPDGSLEPFDYKRGFFLDVAQNDGPVKKVFSETATTEEDARLVAEEWLGKSWND